MTRRKVEYGQESPLLKPGGTITFSSGNDPERIDSRHIHYGDNERFYDVVRAFPHLLQNAVGAPLLAIDFYPAGFGLLKGASSVVCGMSVTMALKAIKTARKLEASTIFIGQALGTAAVAAEIGRISTSRGGYCLVVLGGYESFPALEKMIQSSLETVFERVEFLHLYGMNEADFALLAGQRDDSVGGQVSYVPLQLDWQPRVGASTTYFEQLSTGWKVPIDDHLIEKDGRFLIRQPESKISNKARLFLESRDAAWWQIHTGYLGLDSEGNLRAQLRRGIQPDTQSHDMTYGAFIDAFGMEIQVKPNWNI